MARTRIKQSPAEIEAILTREARKDAAARKELLLFSRKVWRYWRRIAPVGDPSGARYEDNFGGPLPGHWQQTDPDAGAYRAGIVNRKGAPANGFPTRVIAATDWKSHLIEYGTGGRTPTPEFACRQRTATRFGAMGRVSMKSGSVNKGRLTGGTSLDLSGPPEGKPGKPRRFAA